MGRNVPRKSSPEKVPRMGLVERIKKTALDRDEVTENLLSSMIGDQSPRGFIGKACRLSGIDSPKAGEPLAYYVFLLQKDILKFNITDTYDGCDGKLGPITFHALVKKFSVLSPRPRQQIIAKSKAGRRQIVSKAGLPVLPQTKESNEDPWQKIDSKETVMVGDSLTYQFARSFYKGTGRYKEYKNRFFRGGRSIITMRKKLEKDCQYAKAYIIGAAANDIYYRSVARLESEFLKIIELIKRKNPNAKIVLLTLHGDNYKGWKKKDKVRRKIRDLNNRLRRIAAHDSNISLIDIRKEISIAESGGKKILAADGLHYRYRGSKAVAGLIKDYLVTGRHGRLTDYS